MYYAIGHRRGYLPARELSFGRLLFVLQQDEFGGGPDLEIASSGNGSRLMGIIKLPKTIYKGTSGCQHALNAPTRVRGARAQWRLMFMSQKVSLVCFRLGELAKTWMSGLSAGWCPALSTRL